MENNGIIVIKDKNEYDMIRRKTVIEENLLGFGSEGDVYKIDDKTVRKHIQNYDNRKHSVLDYTRYKDLKLKHYYFGKKVYIYNSEIAFVDYDYCPCSTLSTIDPFKIKLSEFISGYRKLEKDTITLTQNGIKSFDVLNNCMYAPKNMSVIDTTEFKPSDIDYEELLKNNLHLIQDEYLDFLVDGNFNYFIDLSKKLSEMYKEIKNRNIKIYIEFLEQFKKQISEHCGKNINTLGGAKMLVNKTPSNFQRPF